MVRGRFEFQSSWVLGWLSGTTGVTDFDGSSTSSAPRLFQPDTAHRKQYRARIRDVDFESRGDERFKS